MTEDSRRWLEFAYKDIVMARAGAGVGEYDYAAYHLQQAVEKSLKALIIHYDIDIPLRKFKTHVTCNR